MSRVMLCFDIYWRRPLPDGTEQKEFAGHVFADDVAHAAAQLNLTPERFAQCVGVNNCAIGSEHTPSGYRFKHIQPTDTVSFPDTV